MNCQAIHKRESKKIKRTTQYQISGAESDSK